MNSDAIHHDELIDEGLTEKLFSWLQDSYPKRLLFYIMTTLLMTGLGLVVSTGGKWDEFDWSKDLLAPVAFAIVIDVAIATYAMYRRMLRKYLSVLQGLATAEKQLIQHTLGLKVDEREYFKRILQSHFSEAISNIMLRQGANGLYTFTYTGYDERAVRQQYLQDLKRFIEATKLSYVTLQPGLPFFDENFWFFRTFDDSVNCVRIIMHDTAEEIVASSSDTSRINSYAYEAGKHTTTRWALKRTCQRLINGIPQPAFAAIQSSLPIDLANSIEKGDLVICDHRVVISFEETQKASKASKNSKAKQSEGVVRFFLVDDACEDAIKAVVSALSPTLPPIVPADASRINSQNGVFRLKSLDDAIKNVGSRPYTHKEFTVDLGIIEANAANLSYFLRLHGEPRWVLKANAYGLGAKRITPHLFKKGYTKFAFESVTESLEITHSLMDQRLPDIEKLDILVMEPIQRDQIRTLLEMDASCFVWTKSQINDLAAECVELYGSDAKAKIHLKVRLGLNRFGIKPQELVELYKHAISCRNIQVVGIAGHHHMTSPNPIVEEFQLLFEDCVQKCFDLKPDVVSFPVVHSRSSGSLPVGKKSSRPWREEFRIGGALHGVFPSIESREHCRQNGISVKQAVSLTGRIEAFVEVEPGETISYGGGTYKAQSRGVIGWMNLGYNDGLPSAVAGKKLFKYRDVACELVGVMGMNFSALDVTVPFSLLDLEAQNRLFNCLITAAEDVVVLDNSTPEHSVEKFASENGVPHYSLLTDFGKGGLNKYVGVLS